MASMPVWILNQTVVGFNATLTPLVPTTSGNISLSTVGVFSIEVQISVAFGATPTNRVVLEVYGSADGGVTIDTIPFKVFYAEPVASTTRRYSFTVSNRSWIHLVADSRDEVSSVAVSALYSGLQIS
jgi:hypothetical protein